MSNHLDSPAGNAPLASGDFVLEHAVLNEVAVEGTSSVRIFTHQTGDIDVQIDPPSATESKTEWAERIKREFELSLNAVMVEGSWQ